MINTFYSLDALGTPQAFFLALLVGFGFGFALERAGFGSSRRLAGVFYFTDMAVVKVMFTALLTAMLGLSYLVGFGWIQLDQIFLMPTIYGAQAVGGLLFGVGFVMGGWCPGTAAAGVAAGRIDAIVFLLGAIGGSILFNELFPMIRSLYTAGDQGVQMAYTTVGMSAQLVHPRVYGDGRGCLLAGGVGRKEVHGPRAVLGFSIPQGLQPGVGGASERLVRTEPRHNRSCCKVRGHGHRNGSLTRRL